MGGHTQTQTDTHTPERGPRWPMAVFQEQKTNLGIAASPLRDFSVCGGMSSGIDSLTPAGFPACGLHALQDRQFECTPG